MKTLVTCLILFRVYCILIQHLRGHRPHHCISFKVLRCAFQSGFPPPKFSQYTISLASLISHGIHGQVYECLRDTLRSCIRFPDADDEACALISPIRVKGIRSYHGYSSSQHHGRGRDVGEGDKNHTSGEYQDQSPRCPHDHGDAPLRGGSSDVPPRAGRDQRYELDGC